MSRYLGDFTEDEMLYFIWSTNDANGASITRTTDGTISVYKDNNVTQSVAGITDTEDFDSLTGIHLCTIDLSNDAFYAVGADYSVVLSGASIDGKAVNAVLAHFSIENRFEVDVSDLPTNAELEARTLLAADYFDPDNDDVAVVTLTGTTTAVTDEVTANITKISGSATSADGLEAQYDGVTGLTGDLYPSTQAQVGNIASGTAATNTVATSFTGINPDEPIETLTYVNTHALDGVTHDLAPNAGTGFTDGYYEFNVGGNGVPVGVQWEGYANSVGDSYLFYAYNWVGTSWDQVGTKSGLSGSTIVTIQSDLTTAHVGTGANIGLVRFRIYSTGATTGTNISTDRILCSFSTVFQSVGYANGMVWINSLSGSAGTVSYVNGTADNPVDNLADALVIAAALGLSDLHVSTGSTIVLAGALSDFAIHGFNYTFTPGGFALNNTTIYGALISGVIAAGTGELSLWKCLFGNCTIPASNHLYCAYGGTMTLSEAGTYIINDPFSAVAGNTSPIFDCGAVGDQNLNFRHASMGIELRNFGATGTDTASIEGFGQIILAASCTAGGNLTVRGTFTITDNAGGVVNITDDARYDQTQVLDAVIDDSTRIDATALNTLSGHDPGATIGTADPGDEMALINDAITASKYDEITAWPIISVDSGATEIARTGADGDTLEDISDQIDAVPTAAENKTAMEANNSDLDYLVTDLINKKSIKIADGKSTQYNDADGLIGTLGIGYSDDGTDVIRPRQVIAK